MRSPNAEECEDEDFGGSESVEFVWGDVSSLGSGVLEDEENNLVEREPVVLGRHTERSWMSLVVVVVVVATAILRR